MDFELSYRIACAFGIVSSWLSIMLTLMICLPFCLSRQDRVKPREVNFAMSTPSFNPVSEIGDGLLYEEEFGANPVVMSDDRHCHNEVCPTNTKSSLSSGQMRIRTSALV